MKKRTDTACPIVYSLDIWGDPWSLVILRDILVGGKRHYRDFLASPEKIATNILSARLRSLTEAGLLERISGQQNRAQTMYKPTQKALDLLPVILDIMQWGIRHNPNVDMNVSVMQEVQTDKQGLQQRLAERARCV